MQEFLQYIPHREPFLFVDRLIEASADRIRTQKVVKPEEPYFQGHYPGRPIMPGVLLCESVFQTGAILMGKRGQNKEDRMPVVSRIQNVKFKRPVHPGDTLEIEVELKDVVGAAHYFSGRVRVGDGTVLTLEFTAMLVGEAA